MDGQEKEGFFRGRELSRFLILLTITIVGWGVLYHYATRTTEAPEPQVISTGKPPVVKRDDSPEFESVTDKTVIGFRDMAAYVKLLDRARDATPAALSAEARRDVFYAHLWDFPKDYRGVPVRISGTALRSLYYPSTSSKTGWIYEAWIRTPDLPKHPYVCISEEFPKGFPIGQNISETVTFDGYFLKLLRYEAGDVPRAAPMLIGRILWKPHRDNSQANSNFTLYWLIAGLAAMFLVSLARWGLALRRSLGFKSSRTPVERPKDSIAPEDLAAYFGESPDEHEPADRS